MALKVLAVEEHPLTIEGLQVSLNFIEPGSRLYTTEVMDEARDVIIRESGFSLLLIELKINQKMGFELISSVRQQQPNLPIAIFSADDCVNLVHSAFEAGVVGYLSKKLKRELLICAIKLILAGGIYIPPAVLCNQAKRHPIASEFKLTSRETEVLELLARGMSNKSISRELAIAESTTKTHVASIMRTLQVKRRAEVSALMGRLKG